MSISISAKTNYSALFNSLPKNDTSNMTSMLSDYAAIKNGSYGKLVKASYAKNASDEKTVSKNEAKPESKPAEEKAEEKKDIVTINGKEIDMSKIDLSTSKVPDKSKTVYSSKGNYGAATTGELFNGIV